MKDHALNDLFKVFDTLGDAKSMYWYGFQNYDHFVADI